MPKKIHIRPRHSIGPQPFTMALAFMLMFAVIGTIFLFISRAATPPVKLELALNRNMCMDNNESSTASGNKIDLWACNGTYAQEWTQQSVSGGFLLVDGQGNCADDPGLGVGSVAYILSDTCSSSNHEQIWQWSGSQIYNVYSKGCLNDSGANQSNDARIIAYTCSPATTNAEWYAVSVAAPTPSISLTSPSSSTVSGGVSISASASIPSGSVADIDFEINGGQLFSCSNTTTCNTSWDTTADSNGSYTITAIATGSGGGSATTTKTVTVSNQSASPPTTGGGSSGGSSSGGGDTSGGSTDSGGTGSIDTGSGSSTITDNGDTVTFDNSGGDDSSLIGADDGSLDNQGDLGVDSGSTTDTLSTDSSSATNPTTGTSISGIKTVKITNNSITLKWQASHADSFDILYGTNPNKLTASKTFKSTSSSPTYTLTNLPANTKIYISITPQLNGTASTGVMVSYLTSKSSGSLGSVLLLILFVAIIGGVIVLLKRKMKASSTPSTYTVPDVQHMPVYPQEDSAAQAARVNWWLPDEQRQALAENRAAPPPRKPVDDIPDMFDEGRQRLANETHEASAYDTSAPYALPTEVIAPQQIVQPTQYPGSALPEPVHEPPRIIKHRLPDPEPEPQVPADVMPEILPEETPPRPLAKPEPVPDPEPESDVVMTRDDDGETEIHIKHTYH